MSTLLIEARSLNLVYPIYSIRAQSLRNTVMNFAVGGRLLRGGQDVVMIRALENISMDVRNGDRIGIMGHNGSGKTTLLKVIAGVYPPDSGTLKVEGTISSMIDVGLGLDPDATGYENILTMGRMRGLTAASVRSRLEEIVDFTELGSFIHLPLKTYSAGMGMRLVFGVATSFEPDILLLDEWLGAGDAHFVDKAAARMKDIVTKSRCMLLASHSFPLIHSTCNKLMVLKSGRVVYFDRVPDDYASVATLFDG